MENLPGNLGKHVNSLSQESRPLKRARQWTILLVDDHGKVISLSKFKEAVIISASMLFVAVIAAVIFFFLYNNTQNNNKKLRDILSASKKKVSTLRNENDILMARLVISESKVNANYADKQASMPKKPLDNDSGIRPSAEKDSTAGHAKKDEQFSKVEPGENSALVTNNNKDKKPAIVSVDNFNAYYDKDKNILSVQYIIKKTALNAKIAGLTAIILKNNEAGRNEWLILPSDNLIEGKPSGKVGQAFLISNFRKIKFKVTKLTDPNRFKKATVFVFSNKGELLLEKDFPFLIKSLL